MNQYKTEPEYILEQSEKMHLTEKQPGYLIRDYQEIKAELALLSQELNMSVDILGRIRDSVRVLELSVQELQ